MMDIFRVNPCGGEMFRAPPDRPRGTPNLLCDGYRVSFTGIKRPGHGVEHQPPSSAEIKEGRSHFQGIRVLFLGELLRF
jgi:hypothetical protein